MALVVSCRGRRTELGLRMEGSSRAPRGGEILVAYEINDQPMSSCAGLIRGGEDGELQEGCGRAVAVVFHGGQLKIMVPDGSGRTSEATFQLAGWNAIRDKSRRPACGRRRRPGHCSDARV